MNLRRTALRTLATAGLTTALAAAPTSAALAAGATQVSGLMSPDTAGACTAHPAAAAAYVVTGSLVGCWYVDTFDVEHESAAGGFVASGTETFDGCLGSRCGTFSTTYTFTARVVDGVEKHGRCHHPVVGGTEGFAGASGEITMKDLPDGCSTYRGTLRW
jgi:hypothetical protein